MPFGGVEIIVIAVIVLLLFGGSRIPKIARGLGSSVTEFRKGVRDRDEENEREQLKAPGTDAGEAESPDGTENTERRDGSGR